MPDSTSTWNGLVARHAAVAPRRSDDGSVPAHRPRAALLACSDARVPPSVLFDAPAGSLFVVRVAGNSATPDTIASLTYAVEHLGTDLVVVLGHSHCGAVTAALAPERTPALAPIITPIDEMLDGCRDCDDLDAAIAANVRHNVGRLARDRGPLGDAIRAGRVELRGAVHDLAGGELSEVATEFSPHPNHQLLRSSS